MAIVILCFTVAMIAVEMIPGAGSRRGSLAGGSYPPIVAELKARDARRVSDMRQIQTALETYFTNNNAYPIAPAGVTLGRGKYACLNNSGWNAAGCSKAIMAIVPADPGGNAYVYTAAAPGSTYSIAVTAEGEIYGFFGTFHVTPTGARM